MIFQHFTAIILAVLLDKLIGDPPHWPHPVRWMGFLIRILEKSWNRGKRKKIRGTAMVFAVLLAVGTAAVTVVRAGYLLHPAVGIITEAVLISAAIAQKSLKQAALDVYKPLKAEDLCEARRKLSYIVGRDTGQLSEPEIVRGAVETVAENTSDGITAPLFWAMIGGAPLALIYRAINTCDSMVGYRNEKYLEFGWASARLDDLANWIPSRLTSFAMLLANRPEQGDATEAWKAVWRDARKHPSPNSGWGEAAVAAILGVQLGGINFYKGIISDRARMGTPIVPLEKQHILKVNKIMDRTVLLFLLILCLGGMLFEMASAWS
jgi:adenosylcobinamide-phosphate synthase